MHEYYKKYRPTLFKHMVGQEKAITVLNGFLKKNAVPHTILFTGPSGCGKTTAVRILKNKLKCGDADFAEINSAAFRGIDTIRDIRQKMGMAPIAGDCRIWAIDECHKLTNDAQNAFLKMLEDTPSHVYFFLATTDPEKILKTIKTRATEIALHPVHEEDLVNAMKRILVLEKKEVSDPVLLRIAEVAEGSPRKAIVLLESVVDIVGEEEQIKHILANDTKHKSIELAQALMKPKVDFKTRWDLVAAILKDLDAEDPEGLRRMILGYASAVLLKGGFMAPRAYFLLQSFRDPFYDTGRPGLVLACHEVCLAK